MNAAEEKAVDAFYRHDYAVTACWYYVAAVQGSPLAQERMAYFLSNGKGIPQNLAQAFAWAQKAAFHSYTPGMSLLAVMYQDGTGTPANAEEADYWRHAAFVRSMISRTGSTSRTARGLFLLRY